MPEAMRPRRKVLDRVLGHRSREYTGLFRMRHPTLMTPRDFDLSPFFDVIKFNAPDGERFDYRKIHWLPEQPEEPELVEHSAEAEDQIAALAASSSAGIETDDTGS